MFERFTKDARQVVVLAQSQARESRASHIGTEHLLLGMLAERQGVAAAVLAEAGVSMERVRDELSRVGGREVLGEDDADALQVIGVDLDTVRSKAEESFGPGALERGHRWYLGRGRRDGRGHLPFSPRAKKVLELSLREALRLRHNAIGTEHVLLGLLREGQGVAVGVLASSGVAPTDLRRRVLDAVGKAA